MTHLKNHMSIAAVLLSCVLCSGCATFDLGWDKVGSAAGSALMSPRTWLPATGAAIIAAGGWDEDISDWAADRNPIFGSRNTAENASDILVNTSRAIALGHTFYHLQEDRIHPAAIEFLLPATGVAMTLLVTEGMKETFGRSRPNGEDNKSFPSGHSSGSAVTMALSQRYIDDLGLGDWEGDALSITYTAIPYFTGWARIESKKHFPTDVLIGIAIGNFFGEFMNNLFELNDVQFSAGSSIDGGAEVSMTVKF